MACTNIDIDLDDLSDPMLTDMTDLTGHWSMVETLADEPLYDINGDGLNSNNLIEEMPCRFIDLSLNFDGTFFLSYNLWAYDSQSGNPVCDGGTYVSGEWSINEDKSVIELILIQEEEAIAKWDIPVKFNDQMLNARMNIVFFDHDSKGKPKQIKGITTFEKQ